MQLRELKNGPERSESADIKMKKFSDEDDIHPQIRELSESLFNAESVVHVRMILSLYFPDFDWGGTEE